MIASIEGDVLSHTDNSVVIRVSGLGLLVHVPGSVAAGAQIGSKLSLVTYLVVREDSLTLYGFETEEERDFFILLLAVNGIGPRTALAILSTLSVDVLRRAVLSEQAEVFARVPGVGKKTAQKILLYLQGKVGDDFSQINPATFDIDTEVVEALTGLGYSIVEAQAALQSLPRDTPREVETRLRLALQYFSS
jgi:Holliday junction DNA helicase RuvA